MPEAAFVRCLSNAAFEAIYEMRKERLIMKMEQVKETLAIAMWDSSWLRRRYVGGGFESFDKALDELVERGYNAVRIDPFPHMIANAPDGTNSERFFDPTGFSHQIYGFALWGSPWSVYIYPRRDLVDFIKKCESRNVYVILATWLKPTGEPRNEWITGPSDVIRMWNETLEFLSENDCLKNIIGVDIHNEIPNGACNNWLYSQLSAIEEPSEKQKFYTNYFHKVISELKKNWPELSISASCDGAFFFKVLDMDYTHFDFLDIHIWAERVACDFLKDTEMEQIRQFGFITGKSSKTSYVGVKRELPPDVHFEEISNQIHENWYKNRTIIEEQLEAQIAYVAEIGKKYGVPIGCTEGWGTIVWQEHPLLSWDLNKDAGIMAAKLGQKYEYKFNCQSNFCGPQFASLWKDIDYHQEVTSIIRGNK